MSDGNKIKIIGCIYSVWSACSEEQVIYDYIYYYIQWLLLLFLVIFSASLSERDDFDSGDGKRCSVHKYLMQ